MNPQVCHAGATRGSLAGYPTGHPGTEPRAQGRGGACAQGHRGKFETVRLGDSAGMGASAELAWRLRAALQEEELQ